MLFVLFVMSVVITPAYAGDADGLWLLSFPDGTLSAYVMARENAGMILVTNLNPDEKGWQAYYGTFDGTTSHLTTLVNLNQQIEATLNLTSPTSGSVTITSCTPDCAGAVGLVLGLQKIF